MFPFFAKKRIYLDFASATPVLSSAQSEVNRVSRVFGNPGSIHAEGVAAKRSLLASREKIAMLLGVKAREIVFVSGGTEANNLAILGAARKLVRKGTSLKDTHWITTTIEHPSTLECFSEIEFLGGTITHVAPDTNGIIRPEKLAAALRKETVFVSLAAANHEIGVIQPVSMLSQVIRSHEEKVGTVVLFHIDAGQMPLYRASQPHSMGADLVTFDSGKLYGPRGIGAVYVSNRAELAPVMLGGGQERGMRAGTENVALAAGFAAAFECIAAERHAESTRLETLRDELSRELLKVAPDAMLNGDASKNLPHYLNISFPGIRSEYVTLALDAAGIGVATKSACREGEETVSHVVQALGGPEWRAKNTLRLSLGRSTTRAELKNVVTEFSRLLRNHPVI